MTKKERREREKENPFLAKRESKEQYHFCFLNLLNSLLDSQSWRKSETPLFL